MFSQVMVMYTLSSVYSLTAPALLASYPGRVGGERQPGIDCLRMRDHSQKNLGIRLRLEIVGKINLYKSAL